MRCYSPSLRASWLINGTNLVKRDLFYGQETLREESGQSQSAILATGIKPIQRQDCLPLESATYFWSTVKLSIDGKIMGMERSVHGPCLSCIECPREKKK